jgi:lipopolysaccharide transport system ATP-binding protein
VELCDRAVLLDSGEKLAEGAPKATVGHYQKLLYAPQEKAAEIRHAIQLQGRNIDGAFASPAAEGFASSVEDEETFDPSFTPHQTIIYEARGARISQPIIRTLDGRQVNGLVRGREYRYCYDVEFDDECVGVRFGMVIKTITGMPLGGSLSEAATYMGLAVRRGTRASVEFRFRCLLNPGVYFMNAGVFGCLEQDELLLHRLADAVAFRVLPVAANRAQEIVDFECVAQVSIDA